MGYAYKAGTVSLTNGSANVTGVDTLWLDAIDVGDQFYVPGNTSQVYEVASITDDTHIVLDRAYQATGGAGQSYMVFRNSVLRGQYTQANRRLTDFITRFRETLTSSPTETVFGLNRVGTSANAGMLFKTAGAALISMGLMGHGSAD